MLKDEITRLKKIKDELERLKDKGERELPAWIGEDTLFIKLIQNVSFLLLFFCLLCIVGMSEVIRYTHRQK